MDWLFFAAFVAFSLWGSVAAWRRVKRRGDVESVASRAGLEYAANDPFNSTRVAFALFRRGDGRGAENVMWRAADAGCPVRAFDYWYYTEHRSQNGGTTRSYEYFTCATVLLNGSWPALTIEREGIVDRVVTTLGLPDLDFESEEFNRLFVVRCEDRRFASALIDPRMIEFLLSTRGELDFEIRGRWLLVWTKRVPPALMPGLLRVCDDFKAHIPHVVWELYPSPFVDAEGEPLPVEDEWLTAEPPALEPRPDPVDALSKSPYEALGEPNRPDYDLDGHVVQPVPEDPWRDAPR